jgi:MoaA/NifB/PqqE/SkfB family radical SAM enzyme
LNLAKSVEPAIDPNNRLTFLLDWEITMKCNLDCDYCSTGIYGGHDNTQSHPSLAECVNTIDFMFKYVDHVMQSRRPSLRTVVLNVYGGEALNHPQIVEILQAVKHKHQQYADRWTLRVTNTTNLILPQNKLEKILPLIDEFTVSYHTNNTPKQKTQFRENILLIKQQNVPVKCVVLMHSEPELFKDAQQQIAWCDQHDVKHLPRQLDRARETTTFDYDQKQVHWFENLYQRRSYNVEKIKLDNSATTNLSSAGRACCGGRQLCENSDFKTRNFFVENKFPDWFCSVDKFFLYVKQVNGEVYVNRDCKMNYQGEVGPIGNLNDVEQILKNQLIQTDPIQCKKSSCLCGLCAPKAKDIDSFNRVMLKYQYTP